jgi:signal transduction histidine kinase
VRAVRRTRTLRVEVSTTAASRARTAAVVVAAVALAYGALGIAAFAKADFHGNPFAGQQFAVGLSGILVGTFVARRRVDHPLGWLLLAGGTCAMATFAGSSILDWMIVNTPDQETLGRVILHMATWGWIATRGCFLVLAALAYPYGWPRTRLNVLLWSVAVLTIVLTCVAHSRVFTFEYFAGEPATGTAKLAEDFEPWGHRAIWVLGLVAIVGMFVRVARLRGADVGRYLPVAIALGLLAVPTLNSLYSAAFDEGFWSWADDFELWTLPAIPVVLAIGVLRKRTLDIDVVLRRTTVYVALLALAVSVYVATVWLTSLLVQQGADVGPALATGLIAIGLLPAHAWLERLLGERIFGQRARPFDVVSSLGSRLESAPADDEALQLVADTLAAQLRLPFVAVELTTSGEPAEVARAGSEVAMVERFPLTYQGETLGALVVGRRTDNEVFRDSERELLTAFARQAGVVAHNASLAHALMESRAVLVEAREEERLRIRRDLHDGLGPMLATVSLSLSAAADQLDGDGELAALLRDLDGEIHDAIGDIRRLVYDLRPPALDQLGLVRALRSQAAHLGGASVTIEVEASAPDVELPSAVELAAYRVAVEAMTNVLRHAQASRCWVEIERNHRLVLRVDDDGVGVHAEAPPGVGLRSMRERVVELGGTLSIARRDPNGTSVRATFPLSWTL